MKAMNFQDVVPQLHMLISKTNENECLIPLQHQNLLKIVFTQS